jgi:hypothetical protein
LQKESLFGDDMQVPPFLHGLGEQEMKPETTSSVNIVVLEVVVINVKIIVIIVCRSKVFGRVEERMRPGRKRKTNVSTREITNGIGAVLFSLIRSLS